MSDAYRDFILKADPHDLIHQLNLEIKDPLASAQALLNMLAMMQNPSPAVQRKIDSGELDAEQMIQQITDAITRTMDMIDFYRETLDNG